MAEMKKQTEFKLYKRDSVFFDQNTAPVNIAYAHEVNDVAILPLGAIEQHGPHCPNGLDSFNAICLAKKVAEKSGATVLPCPMYGGHPYMHMGMPGTITLNYETNMALLHDIIASASNVGYNKFIMLVAHGADSSFIPAVHKLGMEGYFVLASTWYDFLRDNKNVLEDFMWHADEAETSMALSLYGDLVHMDLAIDGGGTPLVDPKWKMAPGEASHRWQFYARCSPASESLPAVRPPAARSARKAVPGRTCPSAPCIGAAGTPLRATRSPSPPPPPERAQEILI